MLSTFLKCLQMSGVYKVNVEKTIKHAFSVLYSDKTWVWTNQSARRVPYYKMSYIKILDCLTVVMVISSNRLTWHKAPIVFNSSESATERHLH